MTSDNGTSRYRDFDAARSESTGQPVMFKLGGEEFECVPRLPGGALLEFVSGADRLPIKGLLQAAMRPEVYERFQARINRQDDVIDLDEIIPIADWLLGVYSARPTDTPSPSSPGLSPIGDTSRVPAAEPASTS